MFSSCLRTGHLAEDPKCLFFAKGHNCGTVTSNGEPCQAYHHRLLHTEERALTSKKAVELTQHEKAEEQEKNIMGEVLQYEIQSTLGLETTLRQRGRGF